MVDPPTLLVEMVREARLPAGVPAAVVNRLNREIAQMLTEPKILSRLKDHGNNPVSCSPEEQDTYRHSDVEKWIAIVAAAHLERK